METENCNWIMWRTFLIFCLQTASLEGWKTTERRKITGLFPEQIYRDEGETFLKFIRRGHGLYCPHSYFCKTKLHYSRHGPPHVSPGCSYRCRGCTCDKDCEKFEDCCPNKKNKVGLYISREEARISCTSTFLKTHSVHDVHEAPNIAMVKKCPKNYRNKSISENCHKEVSSIEDVTFMTPVTDSKFVTYKNSFCAVCNDVKNYTDWSIIKGCNSMLHLPSYKTYKEIIQTLWNEEQCFFKTVISMKFLRRLRTCQVPDKYVISTCNVTGLWENYDADIEKACHSYTSIFADKYRNPFCYMCNSAGTGLFDMCEPRIKPFSFMTPSFSSILNFNLMPGSAEDQEITDGENTIVECPVGFTTDGLTGRCREIHCFPGKWLRDGNCKTIITPRKGTLFTSQVTYVLSPKYNNFTKKHRSSTEMENFAHNFYKKIEQEFSDILGTKFEADLAISFPQHLIEAKIVEMGKTAEERISEMEIRLKVVIHTRNRDVNLDFDSLERTLNELSVYPVKIELWNTTVDFIPSQQESIADREKREANPYNSFSLNRIRDWLHDRDNPLTISAHAVRTCPHFVLSEDEFEKETGGLRLKQYGRLVDGRNFEIFNQTSARVCLKSVITQKAQAILKSRELEYSVEGLLTLILTCISLVCLFATILVYLILSPLRTAPGLNNLALAFSLLFAQAVFQFGAGQTGNQDICSAIGIVVHYAWLSVLFWMNVCSIHMFRVFTFLGLEVPSSDTSAQTFLYYSLYAQASPLVFIALNIVISMTTKNQLGYGSQYLCFISERNMLGQTFALPCGLIILSNIVMFVIVVVSIQKTSQRAAKVSANQKEEQHYIHVYFRLSTLTGITWIFGFLYQWTAHIAFSYIFIVLNALQGLFIFLAFVCNKRVFNLIRAKCGCKTQTRTLTSSRTTRKELFSSMSSLNKNKI